jgi:DNA polymerase V
MGVTISAMYPVEEAAEFLNITIIDVTVSAGKPSPMEDSGEHRVNLNTLLVRNPKTTYLMPVSGDSMEEGISHGDWLLVDTSLEAADGKIAVVEIDGDYTLKRLSKTRNKLRLMPDNKSYSALSINKEQDCRVWGIVTHVIKRVN